MKTIHTVTFNPVIDLIYKTDVFEKGTTFRSSSFQKIAAGKGINVSYALSSFDVPSHAYLLISHTALMMYEDSCKEKNITPHSIVTPASVRYHVTLLEENDQRITHVQTVGEPVPEQSGEDMVEEILDNIHLEDILVLSGSLPPGIDSSIYGQLIDRSKQEGVMVLLDSSGEALKAGLKERPFLVKLNKEEAEELTGKKITCPQDEFAVLHQIHQMSDTPLIVISLGSEGMLAASEEGIWKISVPVLTDEIKDSVGCGDAMVAGMAYGVQQEMGIEDLFLQGIAWATASLVQVGPSHFYPSNVDRFLKIAQSTKIGSL